MAPQRRLNPKPKELGEITMKCDLNVTVLNKSYMVARFLMDILRLADRFRSKLSLKCGTEEMDVTHWLNLMSLGRGLASELEITVEGDNADEEMETIRYLFARHFNEMPFLLN
jgi:phosphotransferase system HPr-like phosphotransfer protein